MFQLLLFSQLMILTALGKEWSKKYSPDNPCALKGSTVFMSLTYKPPPNLKLEKRFWAINLVEGIEPSDLRGEPGYSGRVEYAEDGQNHFSLRLSDVKEADERMYCVRVVGKTQKYLFHPGVTLRVTELRVEIPEEVVEGNKAVLACSTTCSLSDPPAFIWYKNNRPIDTNRNDNNTLTLQPTKAEDTGSYSCAVRGSAHLRSPPQPLSVRHRPKNVSVSISPPGEIVEGSSVTLTCSSVTANPPVNSYEWFKGKTLVGKEKTYNISKISSEDSGEYKCKCSNEVGHQYSIIVTLNVVEAQSTVQSAVIAVIMVCLLSVLLALALVMLRRKKMYCWSEERPGDHDNGAVQSAANDAPQSHSHSANQDEVQYANVAYPRKAKSAAGRSSDEVLYASVQHRHDNAVESHRSEEVQYTTVRISPSHRPEAEKAGETSVIYSSVK